MPKPLYKLEPCNECGALADIVAGKCWLCGAAFDAPVPAPWAIRVSSRSQAKAAQASSASSVVLLLALGVVILGASLEWLGLGILIGILSAPGVVSVAIASLRQRTAAGGAMSWLEKVGIFGLVLAVTLGAVIGAQFVALFVYCTAGLATQSEKFADSLATISAIALSVIGFAVAIFVGVKIASRHRQ